MRAGGRKCSCRQGNDITPLDWRDRDHGTDLSGERARLICGSDVRAREGVLGGKGADPIIVQVHAVL